MQRDHSIFGHQFNTTLTHASLQRDYNQVCEIRQQGLSLAFPINMGGGVPRRLLSVGCHNVAIKLGKLTNEVTFAPRRFGHRENPAITLI